MSIRRSETIDQLLSELKLLEERLLLVKESDTMPFSFLSSSFDRMEKISRLLHELELMQIHEMREQMKRLVQFLSEQPLQSNLAESPTSGTKKAVAETEDAVTKQVGGSSPEKIILPGYRDPHIGEAEPARRTLPEKEREEKPATYSEGDTVRTYFVLRDLKKGISLNDRFLYQRELFNNRREEMDRVMERLNTLGSFEEAESYLRSERNWNFDNQTVTDFLLTIKKGF
ncbi:MAG: hypothetical protein LBH72_03115 [Proteiniphilum sp.]|jgi:hypothetical protein|nr:hypothetical protein [Proteiniphilum sp.]